jgi:neutral ceramidase
MPRAPHPLLAALLGLSTLASCGDPPAGKGDDGAPDDEVPVDYPDRVAGPPVAGMAEALLDLPPGVPLGGYTGRCNCFGNEGEVDKRGSAYVNNFNPSAGVQTRPAVQVLWLENGDQAIAMGQTDAIYIYEGIVLELERRLGAATGRDMTGRVTLSASHSHSAPSNWDKGLTWYLGGDRYNEEIFQRVVGSIEGAFLEAYAARVPAAIGVGIARDWDPTDAVYSDRRPENDALQLFSDIPAGRYKDPNLTMLRVDTAEGAPIGFFYAFGMHGTTLGGDNQLWSNEAPGHTELAVRERFDQPLVVAMMQHGGGDASPRGRDDGLARLETVGELAADAIVDLWERTPVSADPIVLETVIHGFASARDDIRVSRGGAVDWTYAPYDPERAEDGRVYDELGEIISPIDEFNTRYGGAFCGDESPLLPGVGIGSDTFPYSSCVEVETIANVIASFFDIDGGATLPLPESTRAVVSASFWGGVSVLDADGNVSKSDVLWGFFPGETTAMYTEMFRRRVRDELGVPYAIPIGYSQDHQGYLMVTEDWLLGGYEPNINIWGPLQGDFVLDHVIDMSANWLLTADVEPSNPDGTYGFVSYPAATLPENAPDLTPAAGTALESVPADFWSPLPELPLEVAPPTQLRRVQGIAQFMWEGGDPGVDLPDVILEVEQPDGSWAEVLTPSGRPVSDALPDILTAYTPDPLYPFEEVQSTRWWASWQAVGAAGARVDLPLGRYRLHVYGKTSAGGASTWPWPTTDYELTSPPFDVIPAEITVQRVDELTIDASIIGPAAGYRMVHLDGASRGANPVLDATFTWLGAEGELLSEPAPEPTLVAGASRWTYAPPEGAIGLRITDAHGNLGVYLP